MKAIIWLLMALLVVLHHDTWNWHDDRLVWGWMPEGLFYHAVLSLAAAAVWWLATRFAWPDDLDAGEAEPSSGGRPA